MAMFFAFPALFVCNLLKISKLVVEAAGVELDTRLENTQLIDSGNAPIGMMATIAKSIVRSLYDHFPEYLQLENSIFGRPLNSETSILKFDISITQACQNWASDLAPAKRSP